MRIASVISEPEFKPSNQASSTETLRARPAEIRRSAGRHGAFAVSGTNRMNDRSTSGAGGLIAEQRREFDDTGLLHLPNAIPEPEVFAMRENLWAELDRKYHFRPDVPDQWPEGQVFGLQYVGRAGGFADMMSPALCAALDDLFVPDGWERPPRWGLHWSLFRSLDDTGSFPTKVGIWTSTESLVFSGRSER